MTITWNDVTLLEQYVHGNRALGRRYLADNRITRFDVIDGFERGWRIFATSGDGRFGFPGADQRRLADAAALAAIATLLQAEEVAS